MLRRALADYPDIEQLLLAAVRCVAAAGPAAANVAALLCASLPAAEEAAARLAHQRFVHFKEGRHGHVFSEAAPTPTAPLRPAAAAAGAAIPSAVSAALRQQTLFSGLPEDVLSELELAMEERAFADGVAVVEEGGEGDFFYVIAEGAADVEKGGRVVLRLGPGSGFGEVALLYSTPRAATVRARVSSPPTRPFLRAHAARARYLPYSLPTAHPFRATCAAGALPGPRFAAPWLRCARRGARCTAASSTPRRCCHT